MSTSEYEYQALSSPSTTIRLLNILPQTEDGTLSLSLREYSLADVNGDYDALSYHWGEASDRKQALVDGTIMLLRENLWQFLNHCTTTAFAKKHHRNLWIDAICINQSDDVEKGYQVQQISKIFGQARLVIVWLGEASVQSCLLQHYFKYFGQATSDERISPKAWARFILKQELRGHASQPRNECMLLTSNGGPLRRRFKLFFSEKDCIREDIERLLHSSYWTRLWVVQEMSLARKASLVVGHSLLPLRALDIIDSARGSNVTMRQMIRSRIDNKERSLPNLVYYLRDAQCTVEHDRVYSMLGLVEGGDKFQVDYTITLEELLFRVLDVIHHDEALSVESYLPDEARANDFLAIDNLASAMRLDPDEVVKHPTLRHEVAKQTFSLPVTVQNVFEACSDESGPPMYVDGDFRSAACFRKHFCSDDGSTNVVAVEDPTGIPLSQEHFACQTCSQPLRSNCLVELQLPYTHRSYRTQGTHPRLLLVLSRGGIRMAKWLEGLQENGKPIRHTEKAAFKIRTLPDQVAKDLNAAFKGSHVDLTRRSTNKIDIPVSFLTLIELRRYTLETKCHGVPRELPPGIRHLSEVNSLYTHSCDETKRAEAEDTESRR